MSELFTGSTAQNLQTLQLSRHKSYRSVITDLVRSYYIELIYQQWSKYVGASICEYQSL